VIYQNFNIQDANITILIHSHGAF